MLTVQRWCGTDLWCGHTAHFSRLTGGIVKRTIAGLSLIIFILIAASCEDELLGDESIVFYNFSSLTIKELKVYYSLDTLLHRAVYSYTNGIAPNEYHIFELPEGYYIFTAQTEDGAIYKSNTIYNYAYEHMNVILSVDYEIKMVY
jgi:hypothetical protein